MAGRSDIARDAVVLPSSVKDSGLGLGLHALGKQGLEAACLPIEEADLQHVELQDVL